MSFKGRNEVQNINIIYMYYIAAQFKCQLGSNSCEAKNE